MSQNSSDKTPSNKPTRRWWALLYLPFWVFIVFEVVQVVIGLALALLADIGVPIDSLNPAVFQTVTTALVFIMALGVTIWVPYLVRKQRTTREELGMTRAPSWTDILLAPAGLIIFSIVSGIVLGVLQHFLTQVNWTQEQQVGFDSLHTSSEYLMACITLVVIAPIAEEVLFRGYLFGKLKKYVPLWAVVVVVSLLFGALHLYAGVNMPLQWNVAFTMVLFGATLCVLRVVTGNVWAGVLLHMLKNGIAFYVLFVDPSILRIIGG